MEREKQLNLPDNLLVEASDFEEVGSILARHAVAEVAPEARVPGNHQLVCLGRQLLALQRIHDVWIVQAEDDGIINLQWERNEGPFSRFIKFRPDNSLFDSVSCSIGNGRGTLH